MSTDSDFDNVVNNTDMTTVTMNPLRYKGLSGIHETAAKEEENAEVDERMELSTKDLLSWSYQIAKGMEHLANRRVIHGDLAARNILLSDNNVVKICDFGLAKNMYSNQNYQKTSGGPLPIKWMAVESLTYRLFSSQSDVWSYGIVLWELFSLSKTPYPGLEPDESFQRKLEAGHRMRQPPYAPDEIFKVMTDCWLAEPGLRPTFTELAEKLAEELQEGEQDHYLNLNKPFEEENEERQQKYVYLQRTAASPSSGNTKDLQHSIPSSPSSDKLSSPASASNKNNSNDNIITENTPMLNLSSSNERQVSAPGAHDGRELDGIATTSFFNTSSGEVRSTTATVNSAADTTPVMGSKRKLTKCIPKTTDQASCTSRPSSPTPPEPAPRPPLTSYRSFNQPDGHHHQQQQGMPPDPPPRPATPPTSAEEERQASVSSVSSGFHSACGEQLIFRSASFKQNNPTNNIHNNNHKPGELVSLQSSGGGRGMVGKRAASCDQAPMTPPPSYNDACSGSQQQQQQSSASLEVLT